MLQQNILLKEYSNFKIGGPAKHFAQFSSKEELVSLLNEWKELNEGDLANYFILGGGTNLLFKDDGFDGLVLKDELSFIELEGDEVKVGSGTSINDLTRFFIDNSLSGLEWAGGLPGTVGGAVRGNAGAFGGETKDSVYEVESLDTQNYEIKVRNNPECTFSYRNSVFKSGDGKNEVILNVKFSYQPGNKEQIEKLTREKEDYRKERHPLDYPNIGSIFKNVDWSEVPSEIKSDYEQYIKKDPFPVLPAAKLIALSGLMGLRVGDAMVSTKHPNFIVNVGNATAKDVREVMQKVKQEIKNRYSISLEEEVYCL